MRERVLAYIAWLTATGVPISVGFAGISATGGNAVVATPPADIRHNQWESDTEVRVWFEKDLVVATSLTAGHVNPGFVNLQSQIVNGTIPAGAHVQSYMIRTDPVAVGPVLLTGFVEFDVPIILVLVGTQIDTTDSVFGRPGVTYNTNQYRGLELDPSDDSFQISQNRRRLDFSHAVGEWTDDIRVITGVACRPELTTTAVVGSSGYGVPNGLLNSEDFFYFLTQYAGGNLAVCDLTTNAGPGTIGYGIPNGVLNSEDFFYYLAMFAQGC